MNANALLIYGIQEFKKTKYLENMGVSMRFNDADAYSSKKKIFIGVGKINMELSILPTGDIVISVSTLTTKFLNENYLKFLLIFKEFLTKVLREKDELISETRILINNDFEFEGIGSQLKSLNVEYVELEKVIREVMILEDVVKGYHEGFLLITNPTEKELVDKLIDIQETLESNYDVTYEEYVGCKTVLLYEPIHGEDVRVRIRKIKNELEFYGVIDDAEVKLTDFNFTPYEIQSLAYKQKCESSLERLTKGLLPNSFNRAIKLMSGIETNQNLIIKDYPYDTAMVLDFLSEIGVLENLNHYLYNENKMKVTHTLDYYFIEIEGHVLCIPEVYDEINVKIYRDKNFKEAYEDFAKIYFQNS